MTRRRLPIVGLSLLFGVAVFALLQGAVSLGWISPYVVPPPSDILATLPVLLKEEGLVGKFLLTLGTVFSATFLAAIIGIPFGWFMYRRPAYGLAYESWLGAAFAAPLVLLYPLFMVLFGRGILAIVVMGLIAGVIPITLHTLQGFRSVPKVYLNVARSLRMNQRQFALKVLFPAALPTIFTGIRLGMIYAMTYVVAIEFLVNLGGLGFLVGDLYNRYNIPAMYGAIVFVVLVSVVLFAGTERLERWLKFL